MLLPVPVCIYQAPKFFGVLIADTFIGRLMTACFFILKRTLELKKKINLAFAISLMLAAVMLILSLFNSVTIAGGIREGEDIVYDESLLSFDTNWKIIKNGSIVSSTSVPGHIDAKEDKTAVITNTLPASITGGTYLAFIGTDSFVSVYINGENVYESPAIENKDHKTPLPGWIFVPLKEEYSLKTISLVFDYPYAFSSGRLPKVLIGTHPEVILYASYAANASLYIGLSMVVLGVIVFIFTMATPSIEGRSQGFVVLGLFMAALGFVLISQANIPRMDNSIYYTEYISSNLIFRILPVLHSIYMYLDLDGFRRKKIYLSIFGISIFLFVLETVLHFAGIWDLSSSLFLARALLVFELFASMLFILADIKKNGSKFLDRTKLIYSVLTALGLLFLIAGIVSEMVGIYYYAEHLSSVKYIGAILFAFLSSAAIIATAYRSTFDKLTKANELTKSRISLMMSQIQPHFVYNTLNAIMAMQKEAPDKAYDLTADFSSYLRYNINALSSVELIPFTEELKHIKVYLGIEKERFRERVNIEYDISDDDFAVPPLSIQPFVENAVKHGVCQKTEGGTVWLRCKETEDAYIVTIEDDGAGFDTSVLETNKRGVGVKNAMYRLSVLADAHTDIESEKGKGTKVIITFPKDRRSLLNENYNS